MVTDIEILSIEGEIKDLFRRAKEISEQGVDLIDKNDQKLKVNWDSCAYKTHFYEGFFDVDVQEIEDDAMSFIRNYTIRPEKVNIDMATIISYMDMYQYIEEKLNRLAHEHPSSSSSINSLLRKNEATYQLLHTEHIKRVKWIPQNTYSNLNSIENYYYMLCIKVKDQQNSHEMANMLIKALEDLEFVLGGFSSLKMMNDEDKEHLAISIDRISYIISKISRLKG